MSKRKQEVHEVSGPVERQQAQALVWAAGCATTDQSHPILTGVHWVRTAEDVIQIAATDTYRLAVVETIAERAAAFAQPKRNQEWHLPAAPVRKAFSSRKSREAGLMYLEPGLVAGGRRAEYDPPVATGQYPRWQSVVPGDEAPARWFNGVSIKHLAAAVSDATRVMRGNKEKSGDMLRFDERDGAMEIVGTTTIDGDSPLRAAYRGLVNAAEIAHDPEVSTDPVWFDPHLLNGPVGEMADMWPEAEVSLRLGTPLSAMMIEAKMEPLVHLRLVVMPRQWMGEDERYSAGVFGWLSRGGKPQHGNGGGSEDPPS